MRAHRAAAAALGFTLLAACSTASKDASPTAPGGSESSADTSASTSKHVTTGLPTAAELEQAKRDVSKLTTRELAGQLIVGEFFGADAASAKKIVAKHHLGGVIFMGNNIPTNPTRDLPAMTKAVNDAVAESGRNWPAVISVDQEGGPVQRLKEPVMQLPGGMAFGAANDATVTSAATKALGQELRALGFTMVMAPDADVTIGPKDTTIGVRSPGSDPQRVSDAVTAQVRGFQEAGIVPVIKHFPGHGSVTTDTHVDVAHQTNSVEALMKRDWVPFANAAKQGVPAMMTAHIVVDAIDPNVPGTLSPRVINDTIRGKLGYQGLIVTDGLGMGAILKKYDQGAAASVSALKAGVDVLLMPHDPGASIDAIEKAVKSGELTRERLIASAARIVATARHQAAAQPSVNVIGSHAAQAEQLAQASITQVGGRCGAPLVGRSVRLQGGSQLERARMTKALQARGVSVDADGVDSRGVDSPGGDSQSSTVSLLSGGTYNAGQAQAGNSEANRGGSAGASATSAGVQIALDVPYPLAARPKSAVGLAAYGNTQATFDALAKILTGQAKAGGKLPVAVGTDAVGTSSCG